MKKLSLLCAFIFFFTQLAIPVFSDTMKPGTDTGDVLSTALRAQINSYPIPAFNAKGSLAISTSSLSSYGFDVSWDKKKREIHIDKNPDKRFTPLSFAYDAKIAEKKLGDMLSTDIKVFLGKKQLPCFTMGSSTMIYFNALKDVGKITWDNGQKSFKLEIATKFIKVAAGSSHTIALKNDGTVWYWGDNPEIPNPQDKDKPIAIKVNDLDNVADITANSSFSTAIRNDGTVWSWGLNESGIFGDKTGLSQEPEIQLSDKSFFVSGGGGIWESKPVKALELTDVTAADAGSLTAGALKKDGTMWTWGNNFFGQLGNENTNKNIYYPSKVNSIGDVTAFTAGAFHFAAVKKDGTVWCWGNNYYGQLGTGTAAKLSTAPVKVKGLSDIVSVSAGQYFTLALKKDGTVWTWGANGSGQLGNGTKTSSAVPVKVTGISDITAICAGESYAAALKKDGTVWCWGDNTWGQAGNGSFKASSIPVKVPGLNNVACISAGQKHMAALKKDGSIWCWGANSYRQLGYTGELIVSKPAKLQGIGKVSSISGGDSSTIVLTSEGTLWSWGNNDYGQLGVKSIAKSLYPVKMNTSNVISAKMGSDKGAALKADGTVWVWGRYKDYSEPNNISYEPIKADISNVTAISLGDSHITALKKDGTVWTWGKNFFGQCDSTEDGSYIDKPHQVKELSDIKAISAGDNFTLALKKDGTVWAWGNNYQRLTNSSKPLSQCLPEQLEGLSDIKEISASYHTFAAIKNDGTLWFGVIDQSPAGQVKAARIAGLDHVVSAAASSQCVFALKADGTVWRYGSDYSDTDIPAESPMPIQLSGLSSIKTIAAGTAHALAIKSDGTLWAWGNTYEGQVGTGVYNGSNTPRQVIFNNINGI